MDLYLSNAISRDQHERGDGYFRPLIKAPAPTQILNMPLGAKLPVFPGCDVLLYSTELGEKLHTPATGFNLGDPNNYLLETSYNNLHDPHLSAYYKRKKMLQKLKRDGFITDDNKVICSLKEFNDYRQYLTTMKLDFERSYLREQKYLEKQVANLDGPEADAHCLHLQRSTKKTFRGRRGPRKHKFLEMLTEELEKAAEEKEGHGWTQDGIRAGEHHRRKLLLRSKMEEDWKLQEMLLLMRIGQDVRREAKLEAQQKKCRDERAKKKQRLLQKRMSYHFDKMQKLVRRRGTCEKPSQHDVSPPQIPKRISPLRQTKTVSTVKTPFPKPTQNIRRPPVIQSVAKRTPITSALPIKKESPIQVKRETSPLIPVVPKPSPSKPSPLQEKVEEKGEEPQKTSLSLQTQGVQTSDSLLADAKAEKQSTIVKEPQTEDIKDDLQKTDDVKPEEDVCRPSLQKPEAPVCKEDYDSALTLPYDTICDEEQSSFISKLQEMQGEASVDDLRSIFQNIVTWVVTTVIGILYPAVTMYEDRVRILAHKMPQEQYSISDSSSISDLKSTTEDEIEDIPLLTPPIQTTSFYERIKSEEKIQSLRTQSSLEICEMYKEMSSVRAIEKSSSVPNIPEMITDFPQKSLSCKSDSYISNLTRPSFLGSPFPERLIPRSSGPSSKIKLSSSVLPYNLELETSQISVVQPELEDEIRAYDAVEPVSQSDLGSLKLEERISTCIMSEKPDSVQMGITEPEQHLLKLVRSQLTQLSEEIVENTFKKIITDLSCSFSFVRDSSEVCFATITEIQPEECWTELESRSEATEHSTLEALISNLEVSCIAKDVTEHIFGKLESAVLETYTAATSRKDEHSKDSAHSSVYQEKEASPKTPASLSLAFLCGTAKEIINIVSDKLESFATSKQKRICETQLSDSRKSLIENIIQQLCDTSEEKSSEMAEESAGIALYDHSVELVPTSFREQIRGFIFKMDLSGSQIFAYIGDILKNVLGSMEKELDRNMIHKSSNEQISSNEISFLYELVSTILNQVNVFDCKDHLQAEKSETVENCMRLPHCSLNEQDCLTESKPEPIPVNPKRSVICQRLEIYEDINVPGMVVYSDRESEGECSNLMSSCAERKRSRHKNRHKYDDKSGFQKCDLKSGENLVSDAEELGFLNQDLAKKNKNNNKTVKCPILAAAESVVASIFAKIMLDIDPCVSLTKEKAGWDSTERVEQELIIEKSKANNKLSDIHFFSASDLELFALDITESIIKMLKVVSKLICTSNTEFVFAPSEDVCGPLSTLNDVLDNTHTVSSVELSDVSISSKENNEQNKEISACQTCTTSIVGHQLASKSQTSLMLNDVGEQIIIMILMKLRKFFYLKCESKSEYQLFENTFSSEFPSYADIPPLLQATLEPLPDNLSRQISIQVSKPDSSKSDHSGSKNCMLQLELCNCANKVIKNIMDIIQKELNADSLNQQSVSSETYSDENVSFAHADCSPVESQEKNLLLPEGKSLPETYTDENVSFAHADCSPVESQEKNLSLPEGKSLPETYTDENVSFARVDCSPFESQELKLLLPEGKSLSSENISKNIVVVSSFINNILNLLCSEKYVSEMVSKYSAEWSTTSNLSHIQEKDPNVQDNHTDKLKYAGKITLSKNYLKNGTEFPMQECSPEDCILHFIVNKVEAEVISVVANIVSEMMQKFAHSHTFPSHVVSSVITSSSVQSLEISSEPNIYDPSKLQSEYSVDEASLLNLEIQLMSYDIVEDMLNNLCIFVVDQSKTVTDYRNRTEIHDPCIIEGEIAEPGLTREFPLSMLTSIAEDIFITVLAKFERFVKLKLGSWQEATSEESRQGLAEGDEPQNIVDPLEVKRNQSMHIFTSQELAAYADASGTEMQSNESKLTLKCKLHSYAKDISHTIMNVIQNTVEEETQNCILSMFESANEIDIIKKLCSFIVGQSSAQIKETGKEFVLDSNSVQQLEEFKNDNAYLGVCISDFISSPEREEESKDRQQQFESTLGKPESLTMSPVEVQHSSKQMYTYSDQIAVLKVLKNVKDYIFEHVFNKLQEDCKDIQRSQIVQGVKLILGDMFLKYFMDVILPPFFTHSGELSATSKKMVYETFLKLDGKSACTLDSASADSIPPYDTIKIIFLKFHSVFFSSVSLEEILCSEECNHHPNIKAIIKQSNNLLELADKQDSELKTTDEIDIGSQQTTAVEFQNSHFRKEKIHPSSSATYSNVDHILKEVATRIEALAALNNASLECVDSLNKNSARDSASYSSVEHSPFLEGIQKALMGDNADIGALNKKTVSSQLLPKKLNEYAREVVNTILTGIKKRIEEEMKSKIFSMDFREKNSLARKIIQLVLDCVLNRKEFPPNDYTLQEALGLNMHISVAPHNPLAQNAQTFHFEPSSQERILAHVDTPCSRQQDDEAEGKSQLNTEDSSQSFLPQAKDFPSLTSQIQHKNIFPEMLSEELAFRQALEFQIGNTVENALNDIFQRRMYDGENCHFHTSWHEQETFNNNVSQFSESNNTFSNKAKMCSLISKPDINYVSNAVVGIVLESLCSSSKIDMDANGSNPLKKGIQPKSSAESMIEKVATRLKSFTTLPPDSKFIVELQRKKNVITAESSTSEDNIEEITLRRQVQPAFPELITSFSESPSAAARSRIKRNICGKIRNEDEGQLQFDTHAEIIVCKILEFIKSDMNSRMAHQESRRSIPCEQRLVRDTIENLLQSFPTKESRCCVNIPRIGVCEHMPSQMQNEVQSSENNKCLNVELDSIKISSSENLSPNFKDADSNQKSSTLQENPLKQPPNPQNITDNQMYSLTDTFNYCSQVRNAISSSNIHVKLEQIQTDIERPAAGIETSVNEDAPLSKLRCAKSKKNSKSKSVLYQMLVLKDFEVREKLHSQICEAVIEPLSNMFLRITEKEERLIFLSTAGEQNNESAVYAHSVPQTPCRLRSKIVRNTIIGPNFYFAADSMIDEVLERLLSAAAPGDVIKQFGLKGIHHSVYHCNPVKKYDGTNIMETRNEKETFRPSQEKEQVCYHDLLSSKQNHSGGANETIRTCKCSSSLSSSQLHPVGCQINENIDSTNVLQSVRDVITNDILKAILHKLRMFLALKLQDFVATGDQTKNKPGVTEAPNIRYKQTVSISPTPSAIMDFNLLKKDVNIGDTNTCISPVSAEDSIKTSEQEHELKMIAVEVARIILSFTKNELDKEMQKTALIKNTLDYSTNFNASKIINHLLDVCTTAKIQNRYVVTDFSAKHLAHETGTANISKKASSCLSVPIKQHYHKKRDTISIEQHLSNSMENTSVQEAKRKCKKPFLDDSVKQQGTTQSAEDSNSQWHHISKKVLQKVFRREEFGLEETFEMLDMVKCVLNEIIHRMIIDLGHLLLSLPYFTKQTTCNPSGPSTSEHNIVSCTNFLKFNSKSHVKSKANVIVEFVLSQLYSDIITAVQPKDSVVGTKYVCGPQESLQSQASHLKKSGLDKGEMEYAQVIPKNTLGNTGHSTIRHALQDKPSITPENHRNVRISPLTTTQKLVQHIAIVMELFVKTRLEHITISEPHRIVNMANEFNQCTKQSNRAGDSVFKSFNTSIINKREILAEEIVLPKIHILSPLLIFPSCISTKDPKKILANVSVSKPVLEVYAKYVVHNILQMTENELKKETCQSAKLDVDVLSFSNITAANNIISSLLEDLRFENDLEVLSSNIMETENHAMLPKPHSYRSANSSPVFTKRTNAIPSIVFKSDDTKCHSVQRNHQLKCLNFHVDFETQRTPTKILNIPSYSQNRINHKADLKTKSIKNVAEELHSLEKNKIYQEPFITHQNNTLQVCPETTLLPKKTILKKISEINTENSELGYCFDRSFETHESSKHIMSENQTPLNLNRKKQVIYITETLNSFRFENEKDEKAMMMTISKSSEEINSTVSLHALDRRCVCTPFTKTRAKFPELKFVSCDRCTSELNSAGNRLQKRCKRNKMKKRKNTKLQKSQSCCDLDYSERMFSKRIRNSVANPTKSDSELSQRILSPFRSGLLCARSSIRSTPSSTIASEPTLNKLSPNLVQSAIDTVLTPTVANEHSSNSTSKETDLKHLTSINDSMPSKSMDMTKVEERDQNFKNDSSSDAHETHSLCVSKDQTELIVKKDGIHPKINLFSDSLVNLLVQEILRRVSNTNNVTKHTIQRNMEFCNTFLKWICKDSVSLVINKISSYILTRRQETDDKMSIDETMLKPCFDKPVLETFSQDRNYIYLSELICFISKSEVISMQHSVEQLLSQKAFDIFKKQLCKSDMRWLSEEVVGIAIEMLVLTFSTDSSLIPTIKCSNANNDGHNNASAIQHDLPLVVNKEYSQKHLRHESNDLSDAKTFSKKECNAICEKLSFVPRTPKTEDIASKIAADLTRLDFTMKKIDVSVETILQRTNLLQSAHSKTPQPVTDQYQCFHTHFQTILNNSTHKESCDTSMKNQRQFSKHSTTELYTTVLEDIVSRIAYKIFPSFPNTTRIVDKRIMISEHELYELVTNLKLEMLKEVTCFDFCNTPDVNVGNSLDSVIDVKKVVNSVYHNVLHNCESQAALQNQIAKGNTDVVHNIARLILKEIIYNYPQSVSSGGLPSQSLISALKDCVDQQAPDEMILSCEPSSSCDTIIYSATFLEEIISELLLRIVLPFPENIKCDKRLNNFEVQLRAITSKLNKLISASLTQSNVKLIRLAEGAPFTKSVEKDIDKVVDSVYSDICKESGSQLPVYTNLMNDSSGLSEKMIKLILVRITKYALERDISEKMTCSYTMLDADTIIQKVISNICETSCKCPPTKHHSILLSTSTWLKEVLTKLIAMIFPTFHNADMPSEHLLDPYLIYVAQTLNHKVLQNISNYAIWDAKILSVRLGSQTPEEVLQVVKSIYRDVLHIYKTREAVQTALTNNSDAIFDRIACLIIIKIGHQNKPVQSVEMFSTSATSSENNIVDGAVLDITKQSKSLPPVEQCRDLSFKVFHSSSFLEDVIAGLISNFFLKPNVMNATFGNISLCDLRESALQLVNPVLIGIKKQQLKIVEVNRETCHLHPNKSTVNKSISVIYDILSKQSGHHHKFEEDIANYSDSFVERMIILLLEESVKYQIKPLIPMTLPIHENNTLEASNIVQKIVNNTIESRSEVSTCESTANDMTACLTEPVSVDSLKPCDENRQSKTLSIVLSSTIVQEIVAEFLCKLFFNCPTLALETKHISIIKLETITEKVLSALLHKISEKKIQLFPDNNEELDTHKKHNLIVEKVVDVVYNNIYQLSGSHLSMYKSLTNEKMIVAQTLANLIIAEICNLQLLSGHTEDKLMDNYVDIKSSYIVQKVLNDIREMPACSKHLECNSRGLHAPLLEDIVSQFLAKLVIPSRYAHPAKSTRNLPEADMHKIASQFINAVVKEMAKCNINIVKSTKEEQLHAKEDNFLALMVDSVYVSALNEWGGSPCQIFNALLRENTGIFEKLAGILVNTIFRFQIHMFSTAGASSSLYTENYVDEFVQKVKKYIAVHSDLSRKMEYTLKTITEKKEDKTDSKLPKIIPFIRNEPMKVDTSIIAEHLSVLSIKTEPLDFLKKVCLIQTGQTLDSLRNASISGKGTMDETNEEVSLLSDFTVDDKCKGRATLDKFGRLYVRPNKIVCRNSFLNVLKPDVSKVELLKDVQSKQDLLVRLVTHDIQVNEDDEDEDIEEIVLEESPLMDRGDEFEFEKQHGVKAHYWKNSAYSDLNLEKKSTLLSLDRKENVWQETSKYNSCVLGAANLSNSDLRKETHTPGVSHRSVGEAGRNRGRSGITRAVIALDSSSEENYHVEAAKRDLVKCGNSDLSSLDIEDITDSTLLSSVESGASACPVFTQPQEKKSVFTKMSTALSRVFLRKNPSSMSSTDDNI